MLALSTQAAVPDSLLARIAMASTEGEQLLQLVWDNPAIKQLEHSYSLSQAGAYFSLRKESQPLDVQQGDHATTWGFQAQSYMKHRNSTLWGAARYANGRTRHITWNETSDLDIVYPYLLADSLGGRTMKNECYSFSGGYADRRGRLLWGAAISYEAGLYYRNIDPRPRNVTADLQVRAGIGWQLLQGYATALSATYQKYKQTNEVDFYSELGQEKLYHLTGMTNDYRRFAGDGYDTYYNGHRFNASLNWHPLNGRGLSVSLQGSHMGLTNVLTSLNKLPLARISHNELNAEAAWLSQGWTVRAWLDASRRIGSENVFGDAASGVYPEIGSLDNYHENCISTGLEGLWERHYGKAYVALKPQAAFNHRNQVYEDPLCRITTSNISLGFRASGGITAGRSHTALSLGMQWVDPTRHDLLLSGVQAEMQSLAAAISATHAWQAAKRTLWSAGLTTHIALSAGYALKASVHWQHGCYTGDISDNNLFTTIAIVF